MILSMTGFGRGRAEDPRKNAVEIELKSVNHKFFEITPRLPNELSYLEGAIAGYIRHKVSRGKLFMTLVYQRSSFDDLALNESLAKRYYRLIHQLQKKLGLEGPVRLEHLLSVPEIIYRQRQETHVFRWPLVRKALDRALIGLIRTRKREGRFLENELKTRIMRVAHLVQKITTQAPKCVQRYKENLVERMKELHAAGNGILDAKRLETEVALYAKNCDITEEIVRLRSHLVHFRQSLSSKQEIGRQLDFIAQELQREATTIGSKTPDAQIARWGILAKSEIEKIREQVQNIE